jgi:hypothetical protein
MKKLILCLALVCTASLLMMSQDADEKGKSDTRTVTGCLSQGDNAKEFTLTASDGSMWEISSSNVSLAEHVGHTITATGVVSNATANSMKEDTKDTAEAAGATTGATKDSHEQGELKVSDVQMVSDSCGK